MTLRGPSLLALPLAATCLALAIGCTDPGSGLLPEGVTVILSDGTEKPVAAWLVGDGTASLGGPDRVELASGTRAVVVRDEAVRAPAEPALRLTRVRLLDGSHARAEAEVVRYKLRPPG